VATYWITNPDNISATTWPRVPTRRASDVIAGATAGNSKARAQCEDLAASNADPRVQGQRRPLQLRLVHVDRNICGHNTFGVTGTAHDAKENPADANSKSVESVFEDLTSYKNRNGAIWGRGEMHVFKNVKVAGQR